jgi:heme exporter protein B
MLRPPETASDVLTAMTVVMQRDLKSSFRQPQDLLNPLLFFILVVMLFPLGVSPEVEFLQQSGAGILWVAALLSVLLSMDQLFRHDFDDGTLEQLVLQPQPLTGLPLVVLTPVLAVMVHLDGNSIGVLCLTLLIGTPVLSLIGAIGAALTLGLRSAGVLLSLMIIPLYIPVLIFGTGTVMAATEGAAVSGQLALMLAFLVLALTLAPFAAAAALRISLSNG